jgi:hypothetical protein
MSNFQICIDLKSASKDQGDVIVSPSQGFTGGTTTARPTATDEVEVSASASLYAPPGAVDLVVHAMQSTDGQCTRVAICSNGFVTGFWIFDKLKNPHTAITEQFVAAAAGSNNVTGDVTTYSILNGNNSNAGYLATAFGSLRATGGFFSCEGFNHMGYGDAFPDRDDLDGTLPLAPVAVVNTTRGQRGRYGEVYDLWLGSSRVQSCDTYDETGNRRLSTLRDLVLPSNGQILMVI